MFRSNYTQLESVLLHNVQELPQFPSQLKPGLLYNVLPGNKRFLSYHDVFVMFPVVTTLCFSINVEIIYQ